MNVDNSSRTKILPPTSLLLHPGSHSPHPQSFTSSGLDADYALNTRWQDNQGAPGKQNRPLGQQSLASSVVETYRTAPVWQNPGSSTDVDQKIRPAHHPPYVSERVSRDILPQHTEGIRRKPFLISPGVARREHVTSTAPHIPTAPVEVSPQTSVADSMAIDHFYSRRGHSKRTKAAVTSPSSKTVSPYPKSQGRNDIRLCASHGCYALLPAMYHSDFCRRCRRCRPQKPHPVTPTVDDQSTPAPLNLIPLPGPPSSHESTTLPRPEIVPDVSKTIADLKTSVMLAVSGVLDGHDSDDEVDGLELSYPEPTEVSAVPVTSDKSQTSGSTIPPLPRQDPQNISTSIPFTIPSQSHILKSPWQPPAKPLGIRACSDPECTNIVFPGSSGTRCSSCVMRAWKSRRSEISVRHRKGTGTKTVTWADMVADDACEELESCHQDPGPSQRRESYPTNITRSSALRKPVSLQIGDHHTSISAESDQASKGATTSVETSAAAALSPNLLYPSSSRIAFNAQSPITGVKTNGGDISKEEAKVSGHSTKSEGFFSPKISRPSPKPEPGNTNSGISFSTGTGGVGSVQPGNSIAVEQDSISPKQDSQNLLPSLTVDDVGSAANIFGESDSELTSLDDSESEIESSEDSLDSESNRSGLTIRLPPRPGSAYLEQRRCNSKSCRLPLPVDYTWKSCVMCRAHNREYQRKRQNIKGKHNRLDKELTRGPQDLPFTSAPLAQDSRKSQTKQTSVIPGAQLCSSRSCSHILPSSEEYPWTKCNVCRKRAKQKQKSKPTQEDKNVSHSPVLAKEKYGSDTEGEPIMSAVRNKGKFSNRCSSEDCGMLLDPTEEGSECKQCIKRNNQLNGTLQHRIHTRKDRPALPYAGPPIPSSVHSIPPSPYPRYKSLHALLFELQSRLANFLQAQSLYFMCKSGSPSNARNYTTFSFDGEYSIVALNFNVVERKTEVEAGVQRLKSEIERIGCLGFGPNRWVSIIKSGVITRFVCTQQVAVASSSPPNQGDQSFTTSKMMQGELEIAVLADYSHRYFPGQKTIIRFRLYG